MTTAIDSSVLFDLLGPDPARQERAQKSLDAADADGNLVIGEVVYAELMPSFRGAAELDEILADWRIHFVPSSRESAAAAGEAWRDYRKRGGPRERLIGDFLVGAHALLHAHRLLTRDKRFYRGCFRHLQVMEP
jgi:predicted nucleic acid-binding protein